MGCGKPNSAEHAYRIFRKPDTGLADGTNKAQREVAQPGAVVDNRSIGNIVSEGVDGEVTARASSSGVPKTLSTSTMPSSSLMWRGGRLGRPVSSVSSLSEGRAARRTWILL